MESSLYHSKTTCVSDKWSEICGETFTKLLEKHPECEQPKVAYIRGRANYFRQIVYDKKPQFNQPGFEFKIPQKVIAECESLESRARAFEKVASDNEALAR